MLLKKYFNGLILFLWLLSSVTIGVEGWIIIESYSNTISSSKAYINLRNQFSTEYKADGIETQNKKEIPKFTRDGIGFKNEEDMLAYLEKKDSKSKKVIPNTETKKFTLNGIEFKDKGALESYLKDFEKEKFREIFSIRNIVIWLMTGGNSQRILITVLTAFSFGVIGCLIEICKKLIFDNEKLENVKIFLKPLFSGLVAFMILGVAELFPVIFQANTEANVVRPVSLFFMCLFGGIMSERIFTWARNLIADFLKIKFEEG